MKPLTIVGLLLPVIVSVACGGQPGGPTPPTPLPTPAPPLLYSITGAVVLGMSTTPISAAVVLIVDGPNAGLNATTDGSGRYTINGLTFAGFSVSVSAPTYLSTSRGVPLTAGVTSTTANFALLPITPWQQTGTGPNVFTMPGYFQRVRIAGTYPASCQNFIVHLNGRSLVNEIVGTCGVGIGPRYDGVHVNPGGGLVEVLLSSGVTWTFSEER